jgi:hypothetical protein
MTPFTLKLDRQARNKIRIEDHFDLTNCVPRGYFIIEYAESVTAERVLDLTI